MKSLQRFAALTLAVLALSLLPASAGPIIPACTANCTFTGTTTTAAISATYLLVATNFEVDVSGNLTVNGPSATMGQGTVRTDPTNGVIIANTKFLSFSSTSGANGTPDVFLRRLGAANIQFGAAAAASPVAQIVSTQGSRAGTDTNVGGANLTIQSGNGTGIGTASSLNLQSPVVVASGTGAQTQTTLITLQGGLVKLPAITTDATLTDSTVCQDTTTHALYFGSGALGICLGTSSARFKHNIAPVQDGLVQVLALKPVTYRYNRGIGDPNRDLYGFTAEDVVKVMPRLVPLDAQGRPNSVDQLGMVAVLTKALQEEHARVTALEARLAKLEKAAAK